MIENKLRENTIVNNLKELIEALEPGYDALTTLAIKQPGQIDEDRVRTSNVYQIEVNEQEAFDTKKYIDGILKNVRGELQFVFNSLDRYFTVREKREKKQYAWSDHSIKRNINKKA